MTSRYRWRATTLIATFIVMLLGGQQAFGEDCPVAYDGGTYDCVVDSTDVCRNVSSTYICDGFSAGADLIYAISDPDGTDPAMYGTVGITKFCCEDWTASQPIEIDTGFGNDDVYLHDGEVWWYQTSLVETKAGWDYIEGTAYDSCSYPCDEIFVGKGGQGEGRDYAYGFGGDDKLMAPQDDDGPNWLDGGNGNDKIWGGPDDDDLVGGTGNDDIYGGAGADDIDAGAGTDRVKGNEGADVIDGGTGKDYLCGGAGTIDDIDGGYEDPMPYNECSEDDDPDTMVNCLTQSDTCSW